MQQLILVVYPTSSNGCFSEFQIPRVLRPQCTFYSDAAFHLQWTSEGATQAPFTNKKSNKAKINTFPDNIFLVRSSPTWHRSSKICAPDPMKKCSSKQQVLSGMLLQSQPNSVDSLPTRTSTSAILRHLKCLCKPQSGFSFLPSFYASNK